MKRAIATFRCVPRCAGARLARIRVASQYIPSLSPFSPSSRCTSTVPTPSLTVTAAHIQSEGRVLKLHVTAPGAGGAHSESACSAPPLHAVLTYHAHWLRDHCRCASCTHAGTLQRLVDATAIATGIRLQSATVSHAASSSHVGVTWSDAQGLQHACDFNLNFLASVAYDVAVAGLEPRLAATRFKSSPALFKFSDPVHATPRTTWTAASFNGAGASVQQLESMPDSNRGWPCVPLSDLNSSLDLNLLRACTLLRRYGFVFITGVPPTDAATVQVGRMLAPPRRTLYGDTWRTEVKSGGGNDTAYTTLPLPPHTDCTYLSATPGVQVFHALTDTGSGAGGMSLLVDGFAAAQALQAAAPASYDFLTRVLVKGLHIDSKYHSEAWKRVLTLDPVTGALESVAWNNDDRAPGGIHLPPGCSMSDWYTHWRAWTGVLRDPAHTVWLKLRPGNMLIFDNTRVLHGRSEILPGAGPRVLSGMYMDLDDVHSTHRIAATAAGLYVPPYTLM